MRDIEYIRALYRGEVTYLDEQLDRLFSHSRLGAGIIAFTADHGECLGDHGVYWDHAGLYTDTIHVPLVLAWPAGPRGLRVDRPVQQADVGRTLLDLAGLGAREFPGRSVVAELPDEPRFALAAHTLEASLNTGTWHLILPLRPRTTELGPTVVHRVELYDLEADPMCEHDIAAEHPDVARRLRDGLIAWLAASEDTGWAGKASNNEESLAALAELGYFAEVQTADPDQVLFDPDCRCAECALYAGG